jgi:hypothetical protein
VADKVSLDGCADDFGKLASADYSALLSAYFSAQETDQFPARGGEGVIGRAF